MGRSLSLLAVSFICFISPVCFGSGDMSIEIQSGAWWKKQATNISFLEMENYREEKKNSLYLFPNARATIGNCPAGKILLQLGQDAKFASAMYITLYEENPDIPPISMDSFRSMMDSVRNALNQDMETIGKLGNDKSRYTWDTFNGSAQLIFETTKGAGGKIIPKSLKLILAKRNGMAVAVRDAERLHESGPDSTPKPPIDVEKPAAKLTREQLKAKVVEAGGSTYIVGVQKPGRGPSPQAEALNAALSVMAFYGMQNINHSELEKQLADTISANRRRNPLKDESIPDVIAKVLRSSVQAKLLFPEKLVEGKDTAPLIKKCDRDAKTHFVRNIHDVSYRTLFGFPEQILSRQRAGNAVTNDRWFKGIKEQIAQGYPILWWAYEGREVSRIIIGYNEANKEIIYMDSFSDFTSIPLEKAMSYSIWQTVITL